MIEPPGNARRRRILEIDDGIFVAREIRLVEQRAGAMDQTDILEIGVLSDALAIKT
jgi:hypothetical protein